MADPYSSDPPPGPPGTSGTPGMVQCDITGKWVPEDETEILHGYRVCAEGKAELLDHLHAGDDLGAHELTDPGWVTTRKGLTTMYVTVVLMVIGIILFVALVMATTVGGAGAVAGVGAMMLLVVGVTSLGLGIAVLVGQAMCCAVPGESGAKSLAIGAVICTALTMALSMAAGASQGFTPPPAGAPPTGQVTPLEGAANLISIVGYILFILFLRKVALHLGEDALAGSAVKLLVLAICLPILIVVGAVAMVLAGTLSGTSASATGLMAVFGCVMAVVGLILFFWWLRLIKGVRDAIAQRTAATGMG